MNADTTDERPVFDSTPDFFEWLAEQNRENTMCGGADSPPDYLRGAAAAYDDAANYLRERTEKFVPLEQVPMGGVDE